MKSCTVPPRKRARTPTTSLHSSIDRSILPFPTNFVADHSKKSHARKQPPGHIPRPRNAFILFRCDFVRQKKVPDSVEKDHRNISRIAGRIWSEMTDEEKAPWVRMAKDEKTRHLELYPHYRSNSNGLTKKRSKRGNDVSKKKQEQDERLQLDEAAITALDRAASAPPGALHIPQVNLETLTGYGNLLKTRDDLARRPSRVKVYQSKGFDATDDVADPDFYTYFSVAIKEDHEASLNGWNPPKPLHASDSREGHISLNEGSMGPFCGPRLEFSSYPVYEGETRPDWYQFQPAALQTYSWDRNDGADLRETDGNCFDISHTTSQESGHDHWELFGSQAFLETPHFTVLHPPYDSMSVKEPISHPPEIDQLIGHYGRHAGSDYVLEANPLLSIARDDLGGRHDLVCGVANEALEGSIHP